jgi:hypothetical protein
MATFIPLTQASTPEALQVVGSSAAKAINIISNHYYVGGSDLVHIHVNHTQARHLFR